MTFIRAAVLVTLAAGLSSQRATADVPAHVLTYANFKGYYNHSTVAAKDAAPWLDFAMTNAKDAAEIADAGMKVVVYTNPNRVSRKEFGYTDDESMYAHDCFGNRIESTNRRDDPAYLVDPGSPASQDRWKRQVQNFVQRGSKISAVFDDEAASLSQLNGKPCNFNQADWIQRSLSLIGAIPYPVIYNGLANIGGRKSAHMSLSIALNQATNALGGMSEGCYVSPYLDHPDQPKASGPLWQTYENTQLRMAHDGKLFVCYVIAQHPIPADQAVEYRTYAYASFLLSFDLPTSMFSEPTFTSPSAFNVNPEVELVPTSPAVGTPSDVSTFKTPDGNYDREYAQCYIAGKTIGPCAAVVNSDSSDSHPFPFPSKYNHTIVLQGAGVLDGGSIAADGPAPPSNLAPESAVIATQ